MRERTLRHRREQRVSRVLDDGDAAELLDRPQARRPIIEVAGEDDADGTRAEHLRGGAEQRIDGRPEPVFLRSLGRAQVARLDDQMVIGRRDVDTSRLEPFAPAGAEGAQRPPSIEDLVQHAG
jgi:hypothetical protein